ncbi:hypothetical protein ABK040_011899 [Willaertia magna]
MEETTSSTTTRLEEQVVVKNDIGSDTVNINSFYYSLVFSNQNINQSKLNLSTNNNEFGFTLNSNLPIYTKGIKWSPDGLCLLSNSNDNKIRLFELPNYLLNPNQQIDNNSIEMNNNWTNCLYIQESSCVNDFCWYPEMNSSNPNTCFFLTASSKLPIHMWDAFNGNLLATFQMKGLYGETPNVVSVSFNGKLSNGNKIYCGLDKRICVFDTERDGNTNYEEVQCFERNTIVNNSSSRKKRKVNKDFGQTSIISCFSFNPQFENIYAAGCYNNTIGIYDQNINVVQHLIDCNEIGGTGVQQVEFSSSGYYLFHSSRQDDKIVCWDLRNLYEPVKFFEFSRADNLNDDKSLKHDTDEKYVKKKNTTNFATNQRMYFSIDPYTKYCISGTMDGRCKVFDLNENGKEIYSFQTSTTSPVNGVSIHPYLPYLATGTGERKYKFSKNINFNSDDSSEEEVKKENTKSSVKEMTCFKDLDKANHVSLWQLNNERIPITENNSEAIQV